MEWIHVCNTVHTCNVQCRAKTIGLWDVCRVRGRATGTYVHVGRARATGIYVGLRRTRLGLQG